jgi:hypothetical protein
MDKQITQLSKSQPFNFLDDDDEQEEEEENGDHGFEFNTFRSLSKSHNKVLDGTNLRVSFLSLYHLLLLYLLLLYLFCLAAGNWDRTLY